jgi:DNA-binding NtrC family response regulator
LVQVYEASTSNGEHEESAAFNGETVAAGASYESQSSQEYEIENDPIQEVNLYGNDFEQIIELSNSMSELPAEGVSTKDLLNNLEANLIRTALNQTDGNVSKASELLQLGRTSLIQKITKYQLAKG